MAQLGARLDGIEEAVGSNPIGSTNFVIGHQTYDSSPASSVESHITLLFTMPTLPRPRFPADHQSWVSSAHISGILG